MAKNGYRCRCGWVLLRKWRSRKQYAAAKRLHANGDGAAAGTGCEHLFNELALTNEVVEGVVTERPKMRSRI